MSDDPRLTEDLTSSTQKELAVKSLEYILDAKGATNKILDLLPSKFSSGGYRRDVTEVLGHIRAAERTLEYLADGEQWKEEMAASRAKKRKPNEGSSGSGGGTTS